MLKILAATGGTALVVALLAASPAEAKSTGVCPSTSANWELTSLADLGITPETAAGIASLDGNGDGWTCVKNLPGAGFFIFRDNTVPG